MNLWWKGFMVKIIGYYYFICKVDKVYIFFDIYMLYVYIYVVKNVFLKVYCYQLESSYQRLSEVFKVSVIVIGVFIRGKVCIVCRIMVEKNEIKYFIKVKKSQVFFIK